MKIVIFPIVLLAATNVLAATPIDGWYGSVFGGYTYMPDNLSNTTNGLTRTNASYDDGYHAGLRFGYKSNPLRYEGEFTYIQAELTNFSINNVGQQDIGGDTSASMAMANVYYDFNDVVRTIQPFVGIGIGYAWVDGLFKSNGPFGSTSYEGNDAVFAYQATAGLTYNFSENYALSLAYRYVGTDRVAELGKVFQAHLASVGATYRFNATRYK